MPYDAGTAFLQIVPSFAGFVEAMSAEMEKDGKIVGQVWKDGFKSAVGDLSVKVGVDLSNAAVITQSEALNAEIRDILGSPVDIKVDVETGTVIPKLYALKLAAEGASGAGGGGGLLGIVGAAASAVQGLASLSGLAIPALIVAGAGLVVTVAGVAAALGGMALAAGAAVGAFGLVVVPLISQISAGYAQISADQAALAAATSQPAHDAALLQLNTDLANLSPLVSTVVQGVLTAKQAFTDWSAQFQPEVVRVFNDALKVLNPLLHDLTPLVDAGASGFDTILKSITGIVRSTDFKAFMAWLSVEAPGAISTFMTVFKNVGQGISDLLRPLGAHVIPDVEHAMVNMSKAFESWARSPSVRQMVSMIEADFPKIAKLMDTWGPIIAKLLGGFLALGNFLTNVFIKVLDDLGKGITDVTNWMADGVKAIGKFFTHDLPFALAVLKSTWDTVWGDIKKVALDVWDGLKKAWDETTKFLSGVFTDTINAFKKAWDVVWNGAKKTWDDIWGGLKSGWDDMVHYLSVGIHDALEGLSWVWTVVWNTMGTVLSGAWSVIRGVLNLIIGGINEAISVVNTLTFGILGIPHIPTIGGPGATNQQVTAPSGQTSDVVPKVGVGGLITKPTVALIGETGPELVLPPALTALALSSGIVPLPSLAPTTATNAAVLTLAPVYNVNGSNLSPEQLQAALAAHDDHLVTLVAARGRG